MTAILTPPADAPLPWRVLRNPRGIACSILAGDRGILATPAALEYLVACANAAPTLVEERDAAVQRAERAERLHAEAEYDLARLSVRLAEAEADPIYARDAEARRVWQAEGKAPAGICPHCGSTVSVVQRDEWYVARCSHRGCGASGPQHRSLTRAVDWFCRRGKEAP